MHWPKFSTVQKVRWVKASEKPFWQRWPSRALHSRRLVVSAVVRAEILAWPSHSAMSLATALALLDACQLVTVNAVVADEGARIRRETGLKLPDALIAATALLQNSSLVTANAKDFRRVPGLTLIEI